MSAPDVGVRRRFRPWSTEILGLVGRRVMLGVLIPYKAW